MHSRKTLLIFGAALFTLGACTKKDAATSDTTAMMIDSSAMNSGTVLRDSGMIADSIRLDSARRADSVRIVDTLGTNVPPAQ